MKKNILSLAALLIASATFVACSSDDNIINEQPTKAQTYTMTINASKGDGATTRALTLTGKTLNATWATTENIYVKKGETWATGSLQPDANAATATLKGELSGMTIAADDVLTLQFPKSGDITYEGQEGTLADIAANFDYATATVEVESVSATGDITPKTATTTFTNQQAIIKFTLKDKANDAAISPSALTVTDGTSTVELTSIPAATYTANGGDNNVLYVAFPAAGSAKTITLTATVGDDTYTFEKAGITFTNGQYYEITVKMKKAPAGVTAYTLAESTLGMVVGTDGKAYAMADKDNLPTGVTAAGVVAYKDGTSGLVIALTDEASTMDWSTACGASGAAAHTPAVEGQSWKLPSLEDWLHIGSVYNGTDLNTAIVNAGGTAITTFQYNPSTVYWLSTENPGNTSMALYGFIINGTILASEADKTFKTDAILVRAVLAF